MKTQKGIELNIESDWVLKINNNMYRQRQAGRVWNKFLMEKLTSSAVVFRQRKVDECVLYQGESIYILYTDDNILAGPDEEELRHIVSEIKAAGLEITEERYIEDFLVVNLDKVYSEKYYMPQTQLIDQILSDLVLSKSDAPPRTNTGIITNTLVTCQDVKKIDQHFHYRSIIGNLNLMEKSTRLDIAYTVHQCT